MNWLQSLFSGFSGSRSTSPDILFGRYTDAYKSDAQTAALDRSLELFEKGERLSAFDQFFQYLKDEHHNNVQWERKEDGVHFQFWQGSQRILGVASHDLVKAESRVARVNDLNVGFLRMLMEANFHLKFSRFALSPDNCLTIIFDSQGVDASPLKLQHALRELSIQADKKDDLLLERFKTLRPAEHHDFDNIPIAEKEIKYAYIRSEIQQVFDLMDKNDPDTNRFPGTYAYLLLSLAFKLDYLIKPEGFMMDALEKIYKIYFTQSDLTPQIKILQIRREFKNLADRPKEDFFREMYRTQSTFGVSPAVNHQTVCSLIEGEISNMNWPLQHNHEALALAVPMYITGFGLFHYSPPQPDRALFHLLYRCLEPHFFQQLGFKETLANPESGRLDKNNIIEAIKAIKNKYRVQYPAFKPDGNRLEYASPVLFARSYLLMIKDLDLRLAE
jgi:hypothetical protein